MAGNTSLRSQVERLACSTRDRTASVLLERSRSGETCRVRIRIERPTGALSLFFLWHVFPPDRR
ncbi:MULTISPECIES: hypothetical protein [Paraburkholderia]|uniref:hypothetical protein n=1 Tax=Paraburkholderia TaxID=1822464 RepID=UPI000A059DE1|nr:MULTISPECIES: hypothetical protein [Paraburkholderia]